MDTSAVSNRRQSVSVKVYSTSPTVILWLLLLLEPVGKPQRHVCVTKLMSQECTSLATLDTLMLVWQEPSLCRILCAKPKRR
jgi:hypothetical protein